MLRKSLISFAVAAIALTAWSAASLAADWTVARSSGEVWIGGAGVQSVSLGAGMKLPDDGIVTTGGSGRVLLVRGEQSVSVGPNSVIAIPNDEGSGFTTVLQRIGVAEFNVDKRKVKHFAVETPYLAAVVKGTHFVVQTDSSGGLVKVTRGRVEVTDLATGKVVDVTPGQQATVTKSSGLQTSGSGDLEDIRQGTPRASLIGRLASLTPLKDGVSIGVGGNEVVAATASGEGISASVGGGNGVSVGVGGSNGVSAGAGGQGISLGGLLHSLGL